jgi:hypothetical protein
MAKSKAEKAISNLKGQQDRRRALGNVRDAVAEQTKHSTRRLAYDLNGDPH